jgi:MHS family proline/betaine transporter-like MFS transporter
MAEEAFVQEKEMSPSGRRAITAGIIGNVLEWYDFGVYGFFAAIIAAQYFPSDNASTSLIAAFGAFAAGFLMRPLGAAFFGYIGDRVGRIRALQLSVFFMAGPTCLIGFLPTYESIGISAAVLMVALRMMQGLAVGGEYTSSIVFLAEHAPPGQRAYYSSWSMFGAVGGILLGSAVGALLSAVLDTEALHSWGWRLAFISGIVVSVSGYFIRRGLVERPILQTDKTPLVEAFRDYGKDILRVVGLNLVNAVTFYIIFVYAITWLIQTVNESRSAALEINTASMLVMLVLLPVFAKVSDAWGRRPTMLIGMGGIALFAYPLVWLMHHPDTIMIMLGQMGFAVLVACFASTVPAYMTELFPAKVRVTAVSVSYNLSLAVMGGTSPIVAVWLIERSHDDLAFAWYIAATALVSFLIALTIKDRRNEPLD